MVFSPVTAFISTTGGKLLVPPPLELPPPELVVAVVGTLATVDLFHSPTFKTVAPERNPSLNCPPKPQPVAMLYNPFK